MKNKLKENIEFILEFISDIPMFIWIYIMSGGDTYEVERQLIKFESHGKKKIDCVKSGLVVLIGLFILLFIFI